MTKLENLIVTVMEECDEVSQRCSKILRFGLMEVQPGQELNNAKRLSQEFGDLLGSYEKLDEELDREYGTGPLWLLNSVIMHEQMKKKKKRIDQFLELSKEQGTLNEV